ncbi:MAG: hypothetical protein CM15mP127_04620 [Gammaproteobacteria bacterium]|nr:MAG: hypothetical protein CM15mP127_04620 [Gammaproteobacteria bacterium]
MLQKYFRQIILFSQPRLPPFAAFEATEKLDASSEKFSPSKILSFKEII